MPVTYYANIKELQNLLIRGQLRFNINRLYMIIIYHKRYLKHCFHGFFNNTTSFITFNNEKKTRKKSPTIKKQKPQPKLNRDSCNFHVS